MGRWSRLLPPETLGKLTLTVVMLLLLNSEAMQVTAMPTSVTPMTSNSTVTSNSTESLASNYTGSVENETTGVYNDHVTDGDHVIGGDTVYNESSTTLLTRKLNSSGQQENETSTVISAFPEHHTLDDENVSMVENTTDSTTSAINGSTGGVDTFQSSFNLALIPVVAGVVLVIAACLKCCTWFRGYTRGGSKDESYYAVIVHDGDEGHLDMVSESTSTMGYDTETSYCSFLRRNELTVNSVKSLRSINSEMQFRDSPRRWLMSKLGNKAMIESIGQDENGFDLTIPVRKNKQRERTTSNKTSSSSIDEVSEVEALRTAEAALVRKQNRFRVSFVTDNFLTTPNNKTTIPVSPSQRCVEYVDNERPCTSSQQPQPLQQIAIAQVPTSSNVSKPSTSAQSRNSTTRQMVSVATQTTKSFRVSLLKNAKSRHLSETRSAHEVISPTKVKVLRTTKSLDMDVVLDSDLSVESLAAQYQGEYGAEKEGPGNTCRHSNMCNQGNMCGPNTTVIDPVLPVSLSYPLELSVDISNHGNTLIDTDSADEVFTSERLSADVAPNSAGSRCACNKNANKTQCGNGNPLHSPVHNTSVLDTADSETDVRTSVVPVTTELRGTAEIQYIAEVHNTAESDVLGHLASTGTDTDTTTDMCCHRCDLNIVDNTSSSSDTESLPGNSDAMGSSPLTASTPTCDSGLQCHTLQGDSPLPHTSSSTLCHSAPKDTQFFSENADLELLECPNVCKKVHQDAVTVNDVDVINDVHCTGTLSALPLGDVTDHKVCQHCGMSVLGGRRSSRRYNSDHSDYRSASVTSLESSGYADELSFDGSD